MKVAGPCTLLCLKCRREPVRPHQRTGRNCHAEYMKGWRKGKVLVPRELVPRETLEAASARGRKAARRLNRFSVEDAAQHSPGCEVSQHLTFIDRGRRTPRLIDGEEV